MTTLKELMQQLLPDWKLIAGERTIDAYDGLSEEEIEERERIVQYLGSEIALGFLDALGREEDYDAVYSIGKAFGRGFAAGVDAAGCYLSAAK